MKRSAQPTRACCLAPASGVAIAFVSAAAAGQAADTSAASETSAGAAVEEVVVTARRREEGIQSTPVAVTAFSAASLESRNVDSIDAIARYTPSLRFDGAAALSGGNYNATVFIRGVGQNDFAIFSDPGVGIYVDGVYYARSIGGIMDAVDLSSVEVLRGPQGTLFGKNTIGGAVLVNTQRPGAEFGGKVEVTAGSFERRDLKASLDLPLIDDVLLSRLSFATLNRDGYVKRLTDGEDMGDRNADTGKLQLRWNASEDVTVDLAADYTRAREHSAPNKLVVVGPAPFYSGAPFLTNYNSFVAPTLGILAPNGQPTLNASWITTDPFTTYASGPNINDLDLWGASATIEWRGAIGVKSITSYRDMDATFARDGDNTPFTFRETYNDDHQDQLSQEVQFSSTNFGDRLTWVAGLYYFDESGSDVGRADLALGLQPPAAATPPFSPAAFVDNRIDNQSYAAFAQGTYSFTERLSATLGLRVNRDEKKISVVDQRQRDGVVYVDVTREAKWDSYTPKLGLEYQLTDDALVYVSAGKGFKSGGFNARPLASAAEVSEYDPEILWSYELGAKTAWLDHRLIANIATYYSEYEDIQLTVNQTPSNFVANAAKAEIKGVELEVTAKPAAAVDLNLSLAYTDARYAEVGTGLAANQILPITLNSEFIKTPEWSGSFGAQYEHALGSWGSLAWRADVSCYSEIFNDVANSPQINQSSYSLLSARVTFRTADELWQAAVFGTNLTDELYIVSGNGSPGFGLAEISYGAPRQWGASFSRKF